MKYKLSNNKGTAITEAIIILPVLLTILYGLYHVWRVSIIASHTTIAARSEMMLHSLAINGTRELNAENWIYGRVGFSDDAKFYSYMGMFPGVAPDDIEISTGVQGYEYDDSLPNVYDSMQRVMTGMASVRINVPLPGQPFLHGGSENQNYVATAMCSVNPWALSQEQFFGANLQWIDQIRSHPVPAISDGKEIDLPSFRRHVTPIKDLPANQGEDY